MLRTLLVLLTTGSVWLLRANAGDMDSPAGPDDLASAMHTIQGVYNRIADGTSETKRRGGTSFAEPGEGPGSTGKTLDDLYDVASERSRPAKTGQTVAYRTGDDGSWQKGVAWPSARFTDNGDTVTDNLTGLIWAKNANLDGAKSWYDAIDYCNGLSLGGYDDWRLSNRYELESLLDMAQINPALPSEHPFSNVQWNDCYYWTSTTFAAGTVDNFAWRISLNYGEVFFLDFTKSTSQYVWPVRGGQ